MRSVRSLELRGKRALTRVDFNVPIRRGGTLGDDSRICAALPTIRHLLGQDCGCVLMSHLGRPGGDRVDALRLDPVADRLAELLPEAEISMCDEVVGGRAQAMSRDLGAGRVLLLQNLRFHPGEKAGDADFAAQLAALGDVYVNDAFAACHRKDASMFAVPRRFAPEDRAVGLLVEREVEALDRLLQAPEAPFVAVFGGAKVSSKIDAIRSMLDRADRILVGGAMSYTFMKARGQQVGDSKIEREQLGAARSILDHAGDKLLLPTDHVVSDNAEAPTGRWIVGELSNGLCALDIGPETIERYETELEEARTILWNGPMGKFEEKGFATGTRALAEAIARSEAMTVVGGGETGEVVRELGLVDRITHVSTGGGAFVTYVAEGTLPALQVLKEG